MSKAITKALSGSTVTRCAVDWLTTTARDESRCKALWDLGQQVLAESEHEGEFATRGHLHGYAGFTTRHVFVGARADGTYLRLSSQQSAKHWLEALTAAENCSRIDLAVDVHLHAPMAALSHDLYFKSPHRTAHRGRPPSRKLVQDTNGGTTVYFGSRSSERLGRVYDKGRETRTLAAGLWWRWELELKERQSAAAAHAIVSAPDPTSWVLGVNRRFFADRAGVSLPGSHSVVICNETQERSTADKLLHWLASGVRPTVARLIEYYGRERVLTALGIPLRSAVNDSRATTKPEDAQWPPQSDRYTK